MKKDNVLGRKVMHDAVVSARNYSRYLDRLLTATPDLLDGIDLTQPCAVLLPDQQDRKSVV